MKKILITISVVIIVLFIGVAISMSTIVKGGVEKYAPKITQTSVKLGSASLSLISGKGSLRDFLIGSPEGFKSDYVFKMGNIEIEVDPSSLFSDKIIVKNLLIDSPSIVYELNQNGLNINKLLANIRRSSEQKEMNTSSGETNADSPKKQVIIENLKIKNGQITIAASMVGNSVGTSTLLPDIQLTDVGKESDGVSFEAATLEIMKAISSKVANMNISTDSLKGATDD